MPGNEVHFTAWKLCLPVAAVTSVAATVGADVGYGCGISVGYLLGSVMSPDLDQIGITGDEGRAMRHFGLIGVLWTMYWMPYGWLVPHRSFLSHSYVVSTLIRLLYALLPVIIFAVSMQYSVASWMYQTIAGVFVGLATSDAIHITLDKIR